MSITNQAASRYYVWSGNKCNCDIWKRKLMVNCQSREVEEGFKIKEKDYPKKPKKDDGREYESDDEDEVMKTYRDKKENFMNKTKYLLNTLSTVWITTNKKE